MGPSVSSSTIPFSTPIPPQSVLPPVLLHHGRPRGHFFRPTSSVLEPSILVFNRPAAISKFACQLAINTRASSSRDKNGSVRTNRCFESATTSISSNSFFPLPSTLRFRFKSSQWNTYISVRFVQLISVYSSERARRESDRRNKRHDRRNLRKNCERVRLPGNHREPSFQFFSKRERKRERELQRHCSYIAFEFVNFKRDNLSRDFKVVVSSLPRWRREDIAFNNNNNNWPSRGPAICSAQIAKSTNFPSD